MAKKTLDDALAQVQALPTAAKPIRQVMYGVTDFALMRNPKRPAYFVDHTDFIRELEKTRYAMFLRPRRFGKSLMISTLKYLFQGRRDLFKGLWIDSSDAARPVVYVGINYDSNLRTVNDVKCEDAKL